MPSQRRLCLSRLPLRSGRSHPSPANRRLAFRRRDPARAGRVPPRDHASGRSSTSPSRPATARTRHSRAPSPGHTAWRPTLVAAPADADADRTRPAACTSHPPGGLRLPARDRRRHPMNLLAEDGRAPHLADRRDDRARSAARPTTRSTSRSSSPSKAIDDDPTLRSAAVAARRPARDVERRARRCRDYDWSVEQHEPVASMRRRRRVRGADVPRPTSGPWSSEGRLDETFVDAHCQPADVFTHGGLIAHILTFAAHRRTLVAGALIDAGIERPRRRRPAPLGGSEAA